MNDFEKRFKSIKRWGIGIAAVVLFAVIAPMVFLALQGLTAAIVFGAIGFGTLTFAPVIAMKFANWKLKAIKAEARRNPIETQQQVLIKRTGDLQVYRKKIETFNASVMNFETKAKGFAQKYPGKAQEFQDQLSGMRQLLDLRKERYQEAHLALKQFEDQIEEAKARYEMALASLEVNKASEGFDDSAVWDQIKVNESMESINMAVSQSFAQLDSALSELDYNPSKAAKFQTIDVQAKVLSK